jgi:hypothetical protein
MPTNTRILELALKGLQTERQRIDEEIVEVTARLGGATVLMRRRGIGMPQKATPPRGRRFTAAQRKAFSDRMKRYWAEKRRKR